MKTSKPASNILERPRSPRSSRAAGVKVGQRSALGVLALLGFGCQGPSRPVFEVQATPIVWPAPPEQARIRYVGELRSSEDLGAQRGWMSRLGDALFGAEEPGVLGSPRSAYLTRDGSRLWVADPGQSCLHRFDLETRAYLRVESLGETPLISPVGLCEGPEGSFYLCDTGRVAVYRMDDDDGHLLTTLQDPGALWRPVALTFNSARQELFVLDGGAHDIKVLGAKGGLLRVLGRRGGAQGEFNFPCDITDDGEKLWITDTGNQRIQAVSYEGQPRVTFGRADLSLGGLALPKGIALDSEGHVYIVDARFENVQIFDQTGQLLLFLGNEGNGAGEFWLPSDIFIDATDRVWICDSYNSRIQVFDFLSAAKNDVPPSN